jgi:hypothetical protein
MAHGMRYAGGIFKPFHDELMGESARAIPFGSLDMSAFEPGLVEEARAVWGERAQTEFRSIQLMARFLQEVMGAGDPLDVYAGALDLIQDEVRHAALCADLCRAMGAQPRFPDPVPAPTIPGYEQAAYGERALHTAIVMVAINETLSLGFIEDLQARCEQPVVRAVLDATVEDEEGHQSFGWTYIQQSLKRFPASTLPAWRKLAADAVKQHLDHALPILRAIPVEQRRLDAWPDADRIPLGLFGPQRQALVFWHTWRELLAPRLIEVNLLSELPVSVDKL